MMHITLLSLSMLLSPGRRKSTSASHDLDAAIAGTQIGLEKKRQRWLVFLIEREEQCSARITQDDEANGKYPLLDAGSSESTSANRLLPGAEDLSAG